MLIPLLSFSLLLCGCEANAPETTAPDSTVESTAITTEPQTTLPTETEPSEPVEPSELFKEGYELSFKSKKLLKISAKTIDGVSFKQLQGGCTDGKYAYFALNDTKSEDSHSLIYKVDVETLEVVMTSEPLQLDHSNDMTYNEKTGQIIVVHNAPNRKKLSFLDPETLSVLGSREIELKIFSMQYNASRDCYVVGCSGGQNFAVLDSEFNQIAYYEVETTGYTTQGVDADDKYIYFIQYAENVVVVYDWNGERVSLIKLPVKSGEPECIFHIGGMFYFGYSNSGIVMYNGELISTAVTQ